MSSSGAAAEKAPLQVEDQGSVQADDPSSHAVAQVFSPEDMQCHEGFQLSVAQLCGLVEQGEDEANRKNLEGLGGQQGVAEKLKSSLTAGVPGTPEDLDTRRAVYVDCAAAHGVLQQASLCLVLARAARPRPSSQLHTA